MERLNEEQVKSKVGWGHRVRYNVAKAYCRDNDRVVDAACGIGYGSDIIGSASCIGPGIIVYRVDLLPVEDRVKPKINTTDIVADLNTWEADFEFDVGVSFETIEHVENYSNLLTQLKKARKWVICSVPVVPTVHMNEWHKHDFAPLELPALFEDEEWEMYQYLAQPQELSEIYIFKRRDYNGWK